MKKTLLILMFQVAAGLMYAQEKPLPSLPIIQPDICPFECCQYGAWQNYNPLIVYKNEGDTTQVAFTIRPGDKLTAQRGDVYVTRPGLAVMKKSSGNFSEGDSIYILSYRGEGLYDIWYKGKLLPEQPALWDSESGENEASVLISAPEFEWWVQLTNSFGYSGWVRLKNKSEFGFSIAEKFIGMDGCE